LRTVVDPAGKSIVLFGAGGAARAIAVESALAGAASISNMNRSLPSAKELAAHINGKTKARAESVAWDRSYRVPQDTDIVVNATSIGLSTRGPAESRVESLRPGMTVADVIPNPPRTLLLRDAAARGCTVLDGLGMLVNQGVISIRHWTGIDPDPSVMRRKLEAIFGI
jgi:shikimate dehydrogenase